MQFSTKYDAFSTHYGTGIIGLFSFHISWNFSVAFPSNVAYMCWPQVTPLITFTMVLLALSPCLVKAWKNPQPRDAARWIAYAYTSGFLFGWHVHEKASLHFVIPLALAAVQSLGDAKHYFWLSIGMIFRILLALPNQVIQLMSNLVYSLLVLRSLHCMLVVIAIMALFGLMS